MKQDNNQKASISDQILEEISKNLIREPVERIIQKHTAILFFTAEKVFKIVPVKAVEEWQHVLRRMELEYLWDARMPALRPHLIDAWKSKRGARFVCLITNRLPENTNLLVKLIHNDVSCCDIRNICRKINDLRHYYHRSQTHSEFLLLAFLESLYTQISSISSILGIEFIRELKAAMDSKKPNFVRIFSHSVAAQEVYLCHGNLFTPNIFILNQDDITIIDPMTSKLQDRQMVFIGDFAALYADLLLLKKGSLSNIFAEAIFDITENDDLFLLFLSYTLIKACVRIRFVLIEKELPGNNEIYARIEQEEIIRNSQEVLEYLLIKLNNH